MTTNAETATSPSSDPAAASAPKSPPCWSATTSRIGPPTTGNPPSSPATDGPQRRPASDTTTTHAGARKSLRASVSTYRSLRTRRCARPSVGHHVRPGDRAHLGVDPVRPRLVDHRLADGVERPLLLGVGRG